MEGGQLRFAMESGRRCDRLAALVGEKIPKFEAENDGSGRRDCWTTGSCHFLQCPVLGQQIRWHVLSTLRRVAMHKRYPRVGHRGPETEPGRWYCHVYRPWDGEQAVAPLGRMRQRLVLVNRRLTAATICRRADPGAQTRKILCELLGPHVAVLVATIWPDKPTGFAGCIVGDTG